MTSNMISGSSEQLLEQQQQELRNRKLKELVPKKKPAQVKKVSWRERANFYFTSVLVFFCTTAGASLLFLVPLYVDPAISTLTSDFIENPTWCTTTRRDDVVGLMNCSWSSCREGCTSDLYRCTHIYVTYIIETSNETMFANLSTAITASIDNDMQQARTLMQTASHTISNMTDIVHSDEAILLVNIKGCGYPPSVQCKNFSDLYGEEGTVFPCYYSRINRTLVMTAYNEAYQWSMIINFFFVPFVITVVSSVGLCFMHCDCSCQKERNPQQRQRQRERERSEREHAAAAAAVDDRHFCRRPRLENLR